MELYASRHSATLQAIAHSKFSHVYCSLPHAEFYISDLIAAHNAWNTPDNRGRRCVAGASMLPTRDFYSQQFPPHALGWPRYMALYARLRRLANAERKYD